MSSESDLRLYKALDCILYPGIASTEILDLIESGGKAVVMARGHQQTTTLHTAIRKDAPVEVIMKLIEVGGRELVMLLNEDHQSSLHYAIWKKNYALVEVILKLIQVGGKELVMLNREGSKSTLFHALMGLESPDEVIMKLIEVGGKELVELKFGDLTTLTFALAKQEFLSKMIILKLIEVGGKELVMFQSKDGINALHLACQTNAPLDVMYDIIEVGGRDFVMQKNQQGMTTLNCLFATNAPIEVLLKVVEVGGKELVIQHDESEITSLLMALIHNVPSQLILKLIEVGGREVVMLKHHQSCTTLHLASATQASSEVIFKLIEVGGEELLKAQNQDGQTAIYFGVVSNLNIDACSHILGQGISIGIGGEYGIGGIFNMLSEQGQTRIYEKWHTNVAPALTSVISSIQDHDYPPLLQAAIKANAPRNIIVDIINRFDCIITRDTSNYLPINVAIEQCLDWEKGMREVLEATASKQQHSVLYTAAYYGLQWTNHMQELVAMDIEIESNTHEEVGDESASETTLHNIIIIATMGTYNDLDTIYSLLKKSPEVMTSSREIRSSKRKRTSE